MALQISLAGIGGGMAAAVKETLRDVTTGADADAANTNTLAQTIGEHVSKTITDSLVPTVQAAIKEVGDQVAAASAQTTSSGLDAITLRELTLGNARTYYKIVMATLSHPDPPNP